jgi:cytochrome c553
MLGWEGNLFRSPRLFGSKLVAAIAATLALAVVLTPALAQKAPPPPLSPIALPGDASRGAVIGETCYGCHGLPESHNAYPSYPVPRLGGQNAEYITIALQGYRRGTRGHETMQAQASSLSDQDIADIAAYFSSLPGKAATGRSEGTGAEVAAGKAKATACVQCHGQEGVAAAPQWPNLGGQHQSYLEQALTQYKDGRRNDMLMGPLASTLDEQAITEIAAFFAAQAKLHDTPR